uniref:transposase n=1 Tax=Actinophytocola algeriensis TaxID=1768010 RepID=UPI001CEF0C4C
MYCGALGKRGNCQIGSACMRSPTGPRPRWTGGCACPSPGTIAKPPMSRTWLKIVRKRVRCAIPDEVRHWEKWRLALDMIDETLDWGLSRRPVVADAAYGGATALRWPGVGSWFVLAGRVSSPGGFASGGSSPEGQVSGMALRLGIFGGLARVGLPAIPSTSLRAITPAQGGGSEVWRRFWLLGASLIRCDRALPGRRDGRQPRVWCGACAPGACAPSRRPVVL